MNGVQHGFLPLLDVVGGRHCIPMLTVLFCEGGVVLVAVMVAMMAILFLVWHFECGSLIETCQGFWVDEWYER